MKRLAGVLMCCWLQAASAADWEGTIAWSRKVSLGPPVSGVVARVDATVGARVKKDQTLLALEQTPFEANVARARAALEVARIARDEASRDLKQAEELYARTVLSTIELDNARMKYGRAKAATTEAQAALTRAQYELRVSTVRAPFDAIVLSVQAQPGQAVAAGLEPPMLVTVAAQDEYLVVAIVTAKTLEKLTTGQAVEVRVGDQRFEGRVQAIGFEPVADVRETSYEVRVKFKADRQLRAGMAASVELR